MRFPRNTSPQVEAGAALLRLVGTAAASDRQAPPDDSDSMCSSLSSRCVCVEEHQSERDSQGAGTHLRHLTIHLMDHESKG